MMYAVLFNVFNLLQTVIIIVKAEFMSFCCICHMVSKQIGDVTITHVRNC